MFSSPSRVICIPNTSDTHVHHLEILHQLDIASNHKIVHIEREDDDDPVVVVNVDACIRFKRNKSD